MYVWSLLIMKYQEMLDSSLNHIRKCTKWYIQSATHLGRIHKARYADSDFSVNLGKLK